MNGGEPARLAADIRRLRRQLARWDIAGDPEISAELNELYKLVWSAQEHRVGRHRLHAPPVSHTRPLRDAAGFDLKPDPLAARTAAELVAALRAYRQWAGDPPFRQIAAQADRKVAHSTIFSALHSTELPSLKVVLAIVTGCGGGEGDRRAFTTAWRLVKTGRLGPDTAIGPPPLRIMCSVSQEAC